MCSICENDIYIQDEDGGCTIAAKNCIMGKNYCNQCTEQGDLCKVCTEGYFPDENGGCSYTANCEISNKGECIKCIQNYILIGKTSYQNDNIKICKSLNSEDLKNCDVINTEKGICSKCKEIVVIINVLKRKIALNQHSKFVLNVLMVIIMIEKKMNVKLKIKIFNIVEKL